MSYSIYGKSNHSVTTLLVDIQHNHRKIENKTYTTPPLLCNSVLESSQWADFKTAIGCQIWSRFHIEKGQKPLLQSKGGVLYLQIFTIMLLCLSIYEMKFQ